MILRSFLEAYSVAADVMAAQPATAVFEESRFLADCMTLGRQYLLQRRVRNPESVSRHLFKTGMQLLRNRELSDPAERVGERRRAFAAAIRDLVRRLGVVYRVASRISPTGPMPKAPRTPKPSSAMFP